MTNGSIRHLRFSLLGLLATVTLLCMALAAMRWQWSMARIGAPAVLLFLLSPVIAVIVSLVPPGSPLLASRNDRAVVAMAAIAVLGLVIWVIVQVASLL